MTGKITRVAVTYTVSTPDGPRHTFHGLAHMHRHIRPERVGELLDALTVICEELVAVREPMPGNGLAGLPRRAPVTSEGANPVSLMCGNWENCRILHFDGIWSDSRYKAPRQRRYRAGRCHNNHDVLHMKASYA